MKNNPALEKPPEGKKVKGLSSLVTSGEKPSGTTLTPEMFDNFVKTVTSKEYQQKEDEKYLRKQHAFAVLGEALKQKVITEGEFDNLMMSTAINGMLLVSPKMHKRLKPVADKLEKYLKSL